MKKGLGLADTILMDYFLRSFKSPYVSKHLKKGSDDMRLKLLMTEPYLRKREDLKIYNYLESGNSVETWARYIASKLDQEITHFMQEEHDPQLKKTADIMAEDVLFSYLSHDFSTYRRKIATPQLNYLVIIDNVIGNPLGYMEIDKFMEK